MKKGLMVGGLILVVALIILGGYLFFNKQENSNEDNTPINAEESTEYVGEQTTIMRKDFRAIIRADWQSFEIPPSSYIYLPANVNKEDANAEVISISATPLGENNSYTLESLLGQGIEGSRQLIPDFELTENTSWENDNFAGKKIKFTGTQEGIKRNWVQIFGIAYNNLYVIAYSCPTNNCTSYPVYNALAESFEPVKAKQKSPQ